MDGLRGLACAIVLAVHSVALTLPDLDLYIRGTGKVGVWLFFVLSAYLLTDGLLANHRARDLVQYGINRAFRILPPLAVAVSIYLLFKGGGITDAAVALDTTTLKAGPNHFWTIPTEFKFYLALPVIVLLMVAAERALKHAGLVLLVFLVLALTALFQPAFAPDNPITPRYFAVVFGCGIGAAWLASKYVFAVPSWLPWASLGGVALTIALFKSGWVSDPLTSLSDKHYILGPLWALVLIGTLNAASKWRAGVASGPLRFIGRCSFSIYLYHWLIMESASRLAPWYVAIPVSLALSVAAGYLGWLLVERPSYRLRFLPRTIYEYLRRRLSKPKNVPLTRS